MPIGMNSKNVKIYFRDFNNIFLCWCRYYVSYNELSRHCHHRQTTMLHNIQKCQLHEKYTTISTCPFWATICKTIHPMLLDRCLSVCLWQWPIAWIRMPLGMEVGLGSGQWYCVRWEPSSPNGAGHSSSPTFAIYGRFACVCINCGPCPNGWVDQDTTLRK